MDPQEFNPLNNSGYHDPMNDLDSYHEGQDKHSHKSSEMNSDMLNELRESFEVVENKFGTSPKYEILSRDSKLTHE